MTVRKDVLQCELDSLAQAALVLVDPSGAHYTNQAGGNACAHPTARGYLVPVFDDPPLDEGGPDLVHRLREAVLGAHYLTDACADRLDAVLTMSRWTSYIYVDRTRLHDSMEAWVYVQLGPSEFAGFDTRLWTEGILTWPNSD